MDNDWKVAAGPAQTHRGRVAGRSVPAAEVLRSNAGPPSRSTGVISLQRRGLIARRSWKAAVWNSSAVGMGCAR